MKRTQDYPYAEGDPIGTPVSYGYSPYSGAGFLAAWSRSRRAALLDLGGESAAIAPRWPSDTPLDGPPYEARALFRHLARNLQGGVDTPGNLARLRVLLQRFEVGKRVYPLYDQTLRAVDKDRYRDLGLYVDFAALLEAAYEATRELPFLNGLLKILDTLCAARAGLDASERGRVGWLITREARHVSGLIEALGIDT